MEWVGKYRNVKYKLLILEKPQYQFTKDDKKMKGTKYIVNWMIYSTDFETSFQFTANVGVLNKIWSVASDFDRQRGEFLLKESFFENILPDVTFCLVKSDTS